MQFEIFDKIRSDILFVIRTIFTQIDSILSEIMNYLESIKSFLKVWSSSIRDAFSLPVRYPTAKKMRAHLCQWIHIFSGFHLLEFFSITYSFCRSCRKFPFIYINISFSIQLYVNYECHLLKNCPCKAICLLDNLLLVRLGLRCVESLQESFCNCL